MAEQTCPRCGTRFPTSDGWAKSTLSLLIPAPAVPDMATQVRCPHCHHLFTDSDIRHLAPASRISRAAFVVACVALVAWAVYQVS